MTGDRHVRFCERRGVRLPPATHPGVSSATTGAERASATSSAARAAQQPRQGHEGQRTLSGPAALAYNRDSHTGLA
jgi:hypothetical protein